MSDINTEIERRETRIFIRVTEKEKEKITDNANGNISDFIRQAALKDKRRIPKVILQDPNLIKSLNQINSQWNQLNRAVNSVVKNDNDLDLMELNLQLAMIREDLNKLVTLHVS